MFYKNSEVEQERNQTLWIDLFSDLRKVSL